MSALIKTFAATAFLAAAPAFAEDCSLPATPEMPDGGSATMEEMVAGQQAVKAFQTDVQAYRACVDTKIEGLKAAAAEGEADEEAVEAYRAATEAYNNSVKAEEQLAEDFNSAVREFKAANPG